MTACARPCNPEYLLTATTSWDRVRTVGGATAPSPRDGSSPRSLRWRRKLYRMAHRVRLAGATGHNKTDGEQMNAKVWAATILLILALFEGEAFGKSQEWKSCQSIKPAQDQPNHMQNLFKYAQIAERPKHQDNTYMWSCSLPDGNEVPPPKNIFPLRLTGDAVRKIDSQLKERAKSDGFDRAYLANVEDSDGSLSVACKGKDEETTLPIYLKIHAYIVLLGDFLNLGMSFSAEIVDTDNSGKKTTVIWSPYYDYDKKELVYSSKGTKITDIQQVLGNYLGEECAFPAIKLAVTHVCKYFFHDVRNISDSSESQYFDILPEKLDSIRKSELYSTVLTGHSLGGQAVQYIAADPPQVCSITGKITQDTFRAYAFASTRNRPKSTERSDHGQNIQCTLESYLILGDQVLVRLGLGKQQTGRITSYNPDLGATLGSRHGIDEIQRSICRCLKGHGQVSIRHISDP